MANIEFKTLEQFMPYWCQKILPAVYDDSLSYYQLLGRILQKYNEVIEIVNKHSETLIDHENRITAAEAQIELNKEAIEALKTALAELEEEVTKNTENIAKLTERVNGHDEAIKSLQDLIAELQANNRNWWAGIESNHDMILSGTDSAGKAKFVVWSDWAEFLSNANTCFYLNASATGSVGMVAIKIAGGTTSHPDIYYQTFGFLIENDDLHFFTADYTRQGTTPVTAMHGGTDNWQEVELLDITNIKQSLGDGEYDTISQKVLTQLINSKLSADMGITGATAGEYINIAEVDSDGKPLRYGHGTPGGGGTVDVVQTTGQSTTSVMSQKAVTDQLNNLSTKASFAYGNLSDTIIYPTTTGGTDGRFVDRDGNILTRATLVTSLIGTDGKNKIFTVRKTGSTSWDRITWFKASAGEGIYDFAWYETDGTNAKAGVDRLTMATTGLFAVSERSSTSFGQDAPGSVIAGEFKMNKGDLTLEEGTTPGTAASGINSGYFPDDFFDGATTFDEKIKRLMQYAFPVFDGHRSGVTTQVKLRCMGYAFSGDEFNWYAPWFTTSGNAYLALISCNVYDGTTPYFRIRYKTLI